MKRCLNCNKELILQETTNSYLKSNFRLKKFCDDSCRIEFNNKNIKKNYVLKETEHNNKLKEINNFVNGTIMLLAVVIAVLLIFEYTNEPSQNTAYFQFVSS